MQISTAFIEILSLCCLTTKELFLAVRCRCLFALYDYERVTTVFHKFVIFYASYKQIQ